MSDYISLEELKKLDPKAVDDRWWNRLFPFDMATCRNCVTMHAKCNGFTNCEHTDFINSASILGPHASLDIDRQLETIYSLRLFYKDLYASNPPEIESEVPSVQQTESATANRR